MYGNRNGDSWYSIAATSAAATGNPTWRAIPANTPNSELCVFHPAINNVDANADPNIVFPLELLHELAAEGVIGAVAPMHYSFVGLMGDFRPLLEETAPEMVAGLTSVTDDESTYETVTLLRERLPEDKSEMGDIAKAVPEGKRGRPGEAYRDPRCFQLC